MGRLDNTIWPRWTVLAGVMCLVSKQAKSTNSVTKGAFEIQEGAARVTSAMPVSSYTAWIWMSAARKHIVLLLIWVVFVILYMQQKNKLLNVQYVL